MGLRDEITADIAAAFDDDLADAVSRFCGSRKVPVGEPDPISQEQPTQVYTYEGRGVFGSYGIKVVDGLQILRTDIKLTVLQAELTAFDGEVNAIPQVDDRIWRINQVTGQTIPPEYLVISVEQDPAGVSWSIQLRRV